MVMVMVGVRVRVRVRVRDRVRVRVRDAVCAAVAFSVLTDFTVVMVRGSVHPRGMPLVTRMQELHASMRGNQRHPRVQNLWSKTEHRAVQLLRSRRVGTGNNGSCWPDLSYWVEFINRGGRVDGQHPYMWYVEEFLVSTMGKQNSQHPRAILLLFKRRTMPTQFVHPLGTCDNVLYLC
jgi:hypothetical protein